MDPLSDRPRPLEGSGQPGPDVGLVELVDQALVRLDGLRDRPRFSSAITALLVFTLAVGWGLTRWRAVEPIDDRIPGVDEMVAADVAPIARNGDGDGDDGTGASGPPDESADPGTTPGPTDAGPSPASVAPPTEADAPLVVHVSGAVRTEGLVELTAGSRLADAITAAGGPTATADVHRLNLATPLVDGMHIRVPEVGEDDATAGLPLVETAISGAGAAGGADATSDGDRGPVNVNQADATELQRLPGVGPAIAAAIVAWREDNGPFASVDDLLDVPGIGPAKLAAIEDQVVV